MAEEAEQAQRRRSSAARRCHRAATAAGMAGRDAKAAGGGGPAVPADGRAGSANIPKKKVCKFCVEKMDFIDFSGADILSQSCRSAEKFSSRNDRRMRAAPALAGRGD